MSTEEIKASTSIAGQSEISLLCDFLQDRWDEEEAMQGTINTKASDEMKQCWGHHEINKLRYEQIIRRLKNEQ